jgi:hypothetical protein
MAGNYIPREVGKMGSESLPGIPPERAAPHDLNIFTPGTKFWKEDLSLRIRHKGYQINPMATGEFFQQVMDPDTRSGIVRIREPGRKK